MLINLFVLPLFIKNLGADLYGIWILSGVVLGYAGVFDFGFTQGLQKYVAEARVKKDDQELSEVVVTGLGILLTIGLSLGTLIYLSAPAIVGFFNIEAEKTGLALQLLRISALFSAVMWPLRIIDVVLNASMRIKELSWLNGFKSLMQSSIMLVMIFNVPDVVQIKWVVSSVVFGLSLYGIVLLRKYVPEISWRPSLFRKSQYRRMRRFSLGMFYISVLAILSVKVDVAIVGKMLSMEMVAVYVIIAKPFDMINQFGSILMGALMPVTYNILPRASRADKERLICQAVKYRAIILAPFSAVAIWAIPSFIELWVGAAYRPYAIWAQVFVSIHFFMALSSLGSVARAAGEMRLTNSMITGKVFINVVTSVCLVGKLGIGGVILGTLISNVLFGELAFGGVISRRLGVPFRSILGVYFPVVILSMLTCLLLVTLGPFCTSWLTLVGFSAGFYVVLMSVVVLCFFKDEFGVFNKLKSVV